MKRNLSLLIFLFLQASMTHATHPAGLLFNLAQNNLVLTINPTIINHIYPHAGIYIKTAGFSVTEGCTPSSNGYCLFSTSNENPATLTISGPDNTLADIILCLNGVGAISCEHHFVGTRASAAIVANHANTNTIVTVPIPHATGVQTVIPTNMLSSGAISEPYAIYLEKRTDTLWVANKGEGEVAQYALPLPVYPPGSNAQPLTVIENPRDTNSPKGIGEDKYGNIYIPSSGNNLISVYPPGSSSTTTPLRIISGSLTKLNTPNYIFVLPNGTVYVANSGDSSLLVFSPNATGNVSPSKIISGPATLLSQPQGLWINYDGHIWVTNANNTILEFASTASGNTAPLRQITSNQISDPYGIMLDAQGYIYQVGEGFNQINVFAPTANGASDPVEIIQSSTPNTFNEPTGLVLLR